MNEVKRYSLAIVFDNKVGVYPIANEDKCGDYVKNEDYADLKRKYDELESILRNIRNDPMITLRVQQVWKIDEVLR